MYPTRYGSIPEPLGRIACIACFSRKFRRLQLLLISFKDGLRLALGMIRMIYRPQRYRVGDGDLSVTTFN